MDLWYEVIDKYGIAVAMSVGMAFYIWKSTKYIQDDLTKDLNNHFTNIHNVVDKDLRMILIKLIDQQKKMQIEQKGLERSYRTLVEIIAKLSGNGLKHKFMNMLNNDNK